MTPVCETVAPEDTLPVWNPDVVRACTACTLSAGRTNVVLGEGPLDAKIVVVGEAPGAEEDRTGRPFQGTAGQHLDAMLAEAGIARREVYVTNPVKCRPTAEGSRGKKNAKPKIEHIRACAPHLTAEFAQLDPHVIVVMGDTALQAVLGEKGVTRLRGEVMTADLPTRTGVRPVKVLVTFHPASVLYDAGKRAQILSDLHRARTEANTPDHWVLERTGWQTCRSVEQVRWLVDRLLEQDLVAFDTETAGVVEGSGIDMRYAEPICISFSYQKGSGWVVPFYGQLPLEKWHRRRTSDSWDTPEFSWDDVPFLWDPDDLPAVIAELQRFFSSDVPAVAQNGKFDQHVLAKLGIEVRNFSFDTMLAHHLVDENAAHGLEHLRATYTDLPRYEDWKDEMPRQSAPYVLAPTDRLWQYAAADTDVTRRSAWALMEEMSRAGDDLWWVYTHIAHPLSDALFRIERTGMLVDVPEMLRLQEKFTGWMAAEAEKIAAVAGADFNPDSPVQLARLLYADWGLTVGKRTDTGQPSTDADALRELIETVPPDSEAAGFLRAHLRRQKLKKSVQTYLAGEDCRSGLFKHLDRDSRIHSTFKIHRAVTGRLSSADPNLQNITKRDPGDIADDDVDPADIAIRSIFAAPPGYVLLEADFSQLELRIQAYVTGEQVLLDAFAKGEVDQHKLTAGLVFGVPFEEVTKAQRAVGKTTNFATNYGGGAGAIQRATKLPKEECAEILERLRAGYPATESARRRAGRDLLRFGYVQNVFGRRRRFPTYALAHAASRSRTEAGRIAWKDAARMERQAYNFTIQSTGSDILSLATIELVLHDDWLMQMGVIPCLTLHDAFYAYVPVAVIEDVARHIGQVMAGIVRRFPGIADWNLPVDVAWGPRWGQVTGELKGVTA